VAHPDDPRAGSRSHDLAVDREVVEGGGPGGREEGSQ
jgi:hypothetical protein